MVSQQLKPHFPKPVNNTYDVNQKVQGILGQPATLGFAGQYGLTEAVTLKTKIDLKDQIKLAFSWIHNFDKNLKFVYADEFNLTNAFKEPAKSNYNFGVMLEYKL